MTRHNTLHPAECYLIDDSPKNVTAAKACGWQANHFVGPDTWQADLQHRGLH